MILECLYWDRQFWYGWAKKIFGTKNKWGVQIIFFFRGVGGTAFIWHSRVASFNLVSIYIAMFSFSFYWRYILIQCFLSFWNFLSKVNYQVNLVVTIKLTWQETSSRQHAVEWCWVVVCLFQRETCGTGWTFIKGISL